MNLETAENIQCEFEYLISDAYFPIHFVSYGHHHKDWQFAVEFIYRLLICELAVLEPINLATKNDIFIFCCNLARQNPFNETNSLWYYGEVVLTEKGFDLVQTYIPKAFEEWDEEFIICMPFIEALEAIFIDYGVAWNENKPLIPITDRELV